MTATIFGTDPYNARTRECFARPLHAGELVGQPSGFYQDQGIRLQLSASVVAGRVERLRFRCWGCPHTIAAAENFCRQFESRPATELDGFDTAQVMSDLGVPVEKTGRILVLEDTVRSLLVAIRNHAEAPGSNNE